MGKTIVMSLKDFKINGDVLDVGGDDFGVIYNVFREVEREISLDYADNEDKKRLMENKFNASTFFFVLSDVWPNKKREELIEEVVNYLEVGSEIYIWDTTKNKGSFVNNDIKVVLPNNKIKDFSLRKINPFTTCSLEEIKKALEKNCKVVETKEWEEIFYIKALKKSNL